MSISLAGIIAVQYYWVAVALKVKDEEFSRNVNEALNKVVNALEEKEAAVYMLNKIPEITQDIDTINIVPPAPPVIPSPPMPSVGNINRQNVIVTNDSIAVIVNSKIHQNLKHQKKINIHFDTIKNSVTKKLKSIDKQKLKRYSINTNIDINIDSNINAVQQMVFNDTMMTYYQNNFDKFNVFVHQFDTADFADIKIIKKPSHENKRRTKWKNNTKKINKVFNQMAFEFNTRKLPLESRVSKRLLDSLLSFNLYDKNIRTPYLFGVTQERKDSVMSIRSPEFTKNLLTDCFKVNLFPNDIFEPHYKLQLHFPNRKNYLLQSMKLLLSGSLIFTLAIIVTFFVSLITIIRQKKMSDIKSDFINNMTHEFKTPIATISLAADSINNPKTLANQDQIKYFTSMIKEENRRMNTLVESVLQMSLLEKKEFQLCKQPVDVHELIERTIVNFSLQLQKRNGQIKVQFSAVQSSILVDELHFTNVILNLLDNANKYTDEKPDILISTLNRDDKLIIAISDKGMGMSKDVQRKVFEKFYRESTGNIHNVKGFGLGLSYVKAIVTACGGEIAVTSEKGQGSCFEIAIPYLS